MFAFLAPMLLKLSPVGSFLKAIPPKVWYALAIAALLVGGYLYHQHRLHQHDAALIKSTIAAEDARIAKQALAAKKKIDSQLTAIVVPIRSKNDETNRTIIGNARDIGVLGPGKAACPGRASLPAATGGPVAASGAGDAAGPQVPADDLAAVPWPWLVDRAEEHDLDRAEALSWREWYQKLLAAWPKSAAK